MQEILNTLQNEVKIPKKSKCVISVSGGADSMMLLFLMMQTDFQIEVVHFNHMQRDQSKVEADLVKKYCEDNNIPFHYYLIKVGAGNFHHQAHKLRNHYLAEVAKMTKSKYVFTAHHLDDLLETVLIKITRGSNLLGYAGMQLVFQKKKINYVKPLLYTSKSEIIEYVKKHEIPYLDDESNEEDHYLRNRFRHAIVPILKQENPNLLNQISQYNKQMTKAFDFIRKTTISLILNKDEIDLELFRQQEAVIQEDMIAYLIEKHPFNMTYDIVMQIKNMLLSKKPNQRYQLSNTYFFYKSYETALIREIDIKSEAIIEVKKGENILPNMDIFTFLNNSNTHTEVLEKLCYNKLAFPLLLRHRKDGDKLAYSFGRKKLKDLLIDQKIPTAKRDQLWVLCDQDDQILWVQNQYVNQMLGDKHCIYFKLKESTNA